MTAHKRIKSATFLSALTLLALTGCGSPQSGSDTSKKGEPLFTEVHSAAVQDIANPFAQQESTRSRFVTINLDTLTQALTGSNRNVTFNFFDNEQIEVTLEQINKLSDSNFVAAGRIQGDDESAVSLVLNDGILLANVRRSNSNETFEVRYNNDGVHTVTVPHQSEDSCPSLQAENKPGETPLGDMIKEQGDAGILATPVIDMLVVYTPLARSRQGGTAAMKALIQMGIADTNRAFTDSGVNLQVRLAGTMEMKQNESGNWSTDLNRLKGTSDGKWDEVHAERRRLGADQVSLVGSYQNGTSTAGIGFINAGYSSAFTVTKANKFGQYTFTHELGHNLGMNHSDGYVSTAGRFRTIMAYGSYPRIRRFSNPNRTYNGYKTGTASKYDAAIGNRNASRLASFLSPTGARPMMMTQDSEVSLEAAMAADESY